MPSGLRDKRAGRRLMVDFFFIFSLSFVNLPLGTKIMCSVSVSTQRSRLVFFSLSKRRAELLGKESEPFVCVISKFHLI